MLTENFNLQWNMTSQQWSTGTSLNSIGFKHKQNERESDESAEAHHRKRLWEIVKMNWQDQAQCL